MTAIYTHPDWPGFVAAIRANPDDDAPRLQAADWLEEHGAADWAEFVRLSCELTKTESRERHAELCQYAKRFALLKEDWIEGTPLKLVHPPTAGHSIRVFSSYWDCGFVNEIECPAADWLTHGDTLLARQPIRRVSLTTIPALSWIRRVSPIDGSSPTETSFQFVGDSTATTTSRWPDVSISQFNWPLDELLTERWPGVTFDLPPERETLPPGVGTDSPDGYQYAAAADAMPFHSRTTTTGGNPDDLPTLVDDSAPAPPAR